MQKEKSIGRNILIVVLILVTIASVCAGLFAWAKYQSTITGTATGETAKWSFKVSDGDTSTQEIEFPMTRTDNNTSVAEGKIAPGTYGELVIGIDATGTETALAYTIEGVTENLPTNMKFYLDEERTLDLTVVENKFSKGGYMNLNDVGVREEKIYWEWPFETTTNPVITDEKLTSLGINETEYDALITANKFAQANDMIDTAESDKQVSMVVSVTGKQLNGTPVLADLVQVGDYVNYDASSNGTYTFTETDCLNIVNNDTANTDGNITISGTLSTDEDFDSNAKSQWRVINVDSKSGTVELMATDITAQTVTLLKGKGFANASTILNDIGAIYGHGKGAVSGRSIKIEDIEKYSSYDKTTFSETNGSRNTYGNTNTYTKGTFYKEIIDNEGNIIGYNPVTATSDNPITMTCTYYKYNMKNYLSNTNIYNMLSKKSTEPNSFKGDFWIDNYLVGLWWDVSKFSVQVVDNGHISSRGLIISDGRSDDVDFECSVLPIVTLQTNIQTIGQDSNGVWQLDV